MKSSLLLMSGLMILMQPAAFAGQESPPAVENGDTVDRVVQKLGKPQGIVSGGCQIIYYYEQGMVYFVTGRVERALLVSCLLYTSPSPRD